MPTTDMQCNWLGERVATVDIHRAVSNVIRGQEDAGWGPNAVFRFPKHGGTGAIWKGVAGLLPADKQVRWLVFVCVLLSGTRKGPRSSWLALNKQHSEGHLYPASSSQAVQQQRRSRSFQAPKGSQSRHQQHSLLLECCCLTLVLLSASPYDCSDMG